MFLALLTSSVHAGDETKNTVRLTHHSKGSCLMTCKLAKLCSSCDQVISTNEIIPRRGARAQWVFHSPGRDGSESAAQLVGSNTIPLVQTEEGFNRKLTHCPVCWVCLTKRKHHTESEMDQSPWQQSIG